ncbi:MAG: PqqD family protein [Bradymonadales bacterium]
MQDLLKLRFQRPASVYAETLENKTVLMNVDENSYYGLNQSAYWLWHKLINGNSLEECIQLGLEYFDITDAEQLTADFSETLNEMISTKLLQQSE